MTDTNAGAVDRQDDDASGIACGFRLVTDVTPYRNGKRGRRRCCVTYVHAARAFCE